jgi:type III secretion protein Q
MIDTLDALELRLRFEVGDVTATLAELRSVQEGHVFELSEPLNNGLVRILAHGNVLGQGYIVKVGERLGIRVTEFAGTQLS